MSAIPSSTPPVPPTELPKVEYAQDKGVFILPNGKEYVVTELDNAAVDSKKLTADQVTKIKAIIQHTLENANAKKAMEAGGQFTINVDIAKKKTILNDGSHDIVIKHDAAFASKYLEIFKKGTSTQVDNTKKAEDEEAGPAQPADFTEVNASLKQYADMKKLPWKSENQIRLGELRNAFIENLTKLIDASTPSTKDTIKQYLDQLPEDIRNDNVINVKGMHIRLNCVGRFKNIREEVDLGAVDLLNRLAGADEKDIKDFMDSYWQGEGATISPGARELFKNLSDADLKTFGVKKEVYQKFIK